MVEMHLFQVLYAAHFTYFIEGVVELRARLLQFLNRALVRPELAPVDDRHLACDRLQRQRPVDRRVATADDHDIAIAELLQIAYEIMDAVSLQFGDARRLQPLRFE